MGATWPAMSENRVGREVISIMTSVEKLIETLKRQGERLTIQRRLVLDVLCESDDHLTVHDIQQRLHQHEANFTEPTVYRILQWLKDLGLVSQTDLGQRGIVYQLIGQQPHHHLVCLACGHVIDIDDEAMAALRDHLRRFYDFEPRIDHMAIFGLCRACRTGETA
jgi:Fur family ferric uptake transcriptional regulator